MFRPRAAESASVVDASAPLTELDACRAVNEPVVNDFLSGVRSSDAEAMTKAVSTNRTAGE